MPFELTQEQRERWAEIDRKEAEEEREKEVPLQSDPFANFEKEWLDGEIRDGVTNRDVVGALMMLMGRM